MDSIFKAVGDFISAFFAQPPRIVVVLGLVLFGYGWKRSKLNDRYIPIVLPLIGMILMPFMLKGVETTGPAAVEGFVGGSLAVWLNQAYRQLFVGSGPGDAAPLQPLATKLLGRFLQKPPVPDPSPPPDVPPAA